jgi:mono/diheme cytochrome c family protein
LRAGSLFLALGVTGVLAAVTLWTLSAPRTLPMGAIADLTGDPGAGQEVFAAAGCASCHRAQARDSDPRILSGGRRFETEFGTFIAPNISMDPDHGIGTWTWPQFANAVMRGVSPDGAHYFPAFPYTSYIRADPQDVADLWAYMRTLPEDATPSQRHELAFPYNLRRAVGVWKWLYLDDRFVVTGDLTPEETRGRYLAEALAHCAECHTPRNTLGALDVSQWHRGAPNPSGRGRIPAIAGSGFTWDKFDISAYLETGFTPQFDVVGGSMADVVASLRSLPKADLDAIAAYVLRAAQ